MPNPDRANWQYPLWSLGLFENRDHFKQPYSEGTSPERWSQ
jgi:hypothetical protein